MEQQKNYGYKALHALRMAVKSAAYKLQLISHEINRLNNSE